MRIVKIKVAKDVIERPPDDTSLYAMLKADSSRRIVAGEAYSQQTNRVPINIMRVMR